MKFKILDVKWLGPNLQVAFETPYCIREVMGWGGEEAREMAKNNKYIDAIKEVLRKRELANEVTPKIDKKIIGKEFDTEEN
jgi:hypothetical protein